MTMRYTNRRILYFTLPTVKVLDAQMSVTCERRSVAKSCLWGRGLCITVSPAISTNGVCCMTIVTYLLALLAM